RTIKVRRYFDEEARDEPIVDPDGYIATRRTVQRSDLRCQDIPKVHIEDDS
ncbi:Hypothetical predicted protein, partial [Paramuricea clavata]